MQALLILLGIGYLISPFAALVIALIANSRSKQLETELWKRKKEVTDLRIQLIEIRNQLSDDQTKIDPRQEPPLVAEPPPVITPATPTAEPIAPPAPQPDPFNVSDALPPIPQSSSPDPNALIDNLAEATSKNLPEAPDHAPPTLAADSPLAPEASPQATPQKTESDGHGTVEHVQDTTPAIHASANDTWDDDVTDALHLIISEKKQNTKPAANTTTTPALPSQKTQQKHFSRASMEEKLGAYLPVWIGAVALSLAGIFLVRHFIEKGWITEEMRVGLAFAFGATMISGAQWIKRRSENIAAGLAAAGIAVEYGVVIAAVRLYEFNWASPTAGFVCLILITAGAVGLSLRHGQGVAILGLSGGFITPALLGADQIGTVHLFGYLLMLEIGLVSLSKQKAWWNLSLMTMVGGLLWAGAWTVFLFDPLESKWVGLYLMGSISAFVAASINSEQKIGELDIANLVPWASVVAGFGLVAALLFRSEDMVSTEWLFMGTLAAGSIVLAALRPAYIGLAVLGEVACLVMLTAWHISSQPGLIHGSADATLVFRLTLFGYFALFSLGSYAALLATHRHAWAIQSVLSTVVFGLFAQWSLGQYLGMSWAVFYSLIAVALAAQAVPVLMHRNRFKKADWILALLFGGGFAFVAFAGIDLFDQIELTLFFVIELPLIALLGWKVRVPQLRIAAAAMAALVGARLLANPFVLTDYPTSEHWLLNWIPIGYGIPLLAFLFTGQLLRLDRAPRDAEWYEAGAIGLGFAMIGLLIRHGFHPDPMSGAAGLSEYATYGLAWLAAGCMLGAYADRTEHRLLRAGAQSVIAASVLAYGIGCLLVANPLWADPSLNGVADGNLWIRLLYAFMLPTVLSGAFAIHFQKQSNRLFATALTIMSCFLFYTTATEFIRMGFQPNDLRLLKGIGWMECATYGVVWMAMGLGLGLGGNHFKNNRIKEFGLAGIHLGLAVLGFGCLLVMNPLWASPNRVNVGDWFLINRLLYVYGLPALLAYAAWRLFQTDGRSSTTHVLKTSVLVFGLATVGFVIRHGFHPQDMRLESQGIDFLEWGVYAVAMIGAALASWTAWFQFLEHRKMLEFMGTLTLVFGAAAALLGAGLIDNPLWVHNKVRGIVIFNELILVFGLPAAGMALASHLIHKTKTDTSAQASAAFNLIALVLGFIFLNLEVRHGFQGAYLDGPKPGVAEWYAYSAIWIVYAVGLLAGGVMGHSRTLRYASLAVMLVAVCKVFLFDTSHLEDLYRVMSYFGLGISLLTLAFVYQRFVFAQAAPDQANPLSNTGG